MQNLSRMAAWEDWSSRAGQRSTNQELSDKESEQICCGLHYSFVRDWPSCFLHLARQTFPTCAYLSVLLLLLRIWSTTTQRSEVTLNQVEFRAAEAKSSINKQTNKPFLSRRFFFLKWQNVRRSPRWCQWDQGSYGSILHDSIISCCGLHLRNCWQSSFDGFLLFGVSISCAQRQLSHKSFEQAWLEMGQVAFFIQQGRPFLLLLISCSFFSWVMFSRNLQKGNMDVKK